MRDAARIKPQSIRPSDNLELDLGLDSMQRVELLVALEQEIGGDLAESRLSEIYTVSELIDAVRESAGSGKAASPRTQFAGWNAMLQEEPADAELRVLLEPELFKETFWYVVSRLIQIIARDRFHLRVTGLEKLPAARALYHLLESPEFYRSNHTKQRPALGSLPRLPLRWGPAIFSARASCGLWRDGCVWSWWIQTRTLIPAMRAGAFGLRHGGVLLLYPEGERSIDGEPKTFKKGAAILSIHLQVPIVPVAIDGFHEAWPRGKRFQKFAPLQITFGPAIDPPLRGEGVRGGLRDS